MDTEAIEDPITLARLFIAGRNVKRSELVEMVRRLLARVETPSPRGKSPIEVKSGLAGSVFLGPEANRYYTRSEAIALCNAIGRLTS